MAEYNYPNDGKIHTRYSELVRCTAGQIEQVMLERHGQTPGFLNEAMIFGRERHLMFEEEVARTGQLPAVFRENLDCRLDFPAEVFEKEFTAEIFKDIVLHSQPDTVSISAKTLVDYKSSSSGAKQYAKSKQLLTYCYQLLIHGIEINRYIFLVEIWNAERTAVIGYEFYEREVSREEILGVRPFLQERCSILKKGVKLYLKNRELFGSHLGA